MMPPFSAFEETLVKRFFSELSRGDHEEDEIMACAIECAHAACGDHWSDRPDKWPDVRQLNDGPWSSDRARAEHMSRLLRSYWYWSVWTEARRFAVAERIAMLTVQRLVAECPQLAPEHMQACLSAMTLRKARSAARKAAGRSRAARYAERAALRITGGPDTPRSAVYSVHESATSAFESAKEVGKEKAESILIRAVDLWVEAAEGTK